MQCDLRNFDLSVLGKFSVVMADPPWDIHMELPYGTMADDEMRKLPVPSMQVRAEMSMHFLSTQSKSNQMSENPEMGQILICSL